MIPVIIDGTNYNLPTSWSEITTSQYLKMMQCEELNEAELLSILTGIDYGKLVNLDMSKFNADILQHLNFATEIIPLEEFTKPEKITLNGKEITVPVDLTKETWFQRTVIKEQATQAAKENNFFAHMIRSITIYVQPLMNEKNEVTGREYPTIDKYVAELPISQSFPLADFFLSRFLKFFPAKQNS